MTKRIALAAAVLLTLGTAAGAGSFFYGQQPTQTVQITLPSDHEPVTRRVTPEMIAMWKASAASADSMGTKAPI